MLLSLLRKRCVSAAAGATAAAGGGIADANAPISHFIVIVIVVVVNDDFRRDALCVHFDLLLSLLCAALLPLCVQLGVLCVAVDGPAEVCEELAEPAHVARVVRRLERNGQQRLCNDPVCVAERAAEALVVEGAQNPGLYKDASVAEDLEQHVDNLRSRLTLLPLLCLEDALPDVLHCVRQALGEVYLEVWCYVFEHVPLGVNNVEQLVGDGDKVLSAPRASHVGKEVQVLGNVAPAHLALVDVCNELCCDAAAVVGVEAAAGRCCCCVYHDIAEDCSQDACNPSKPLLDALLGDLFFVVGAKDAQDVPVHRCHVSAVELDVKGRKRLCNAFVVGAQLGVLVDINAEGVNAVKGVEGLDKGRAQELTALVLCWQ